MSTSERSETQVHDIQNQLLRVTNQKVQKMYEDKKQTPSLVIPKNLVLFIKTTKYNNFINCVYQYCQHFNSIMKKYKDLKQVMSDRLNSETVILQQQKQDLQNLQKQLSYHYAIILLDNVSKSAYKDQFFFETLIYFISRVIKQFFTREQYALIQQQINRLFRTNRYNLIKKRHQNDKNMKQYPILKDLNNKNKININYILNKVPQQMEALKKIQKRQKRKEYQSQSKDQYSTIMGINEIKDLDQRSPLLCTWLPSKKTMVKDYLKPNNNSYLIRTGQQISSYYGRKNYQE